MTQDIGLLVRLFRLSHAGVPPSRCSSAPPEIAKGHAGQEQTHLPQWAFRLLDAHIRLKR